jgi:hypothetical protein
MRIFTAAVASLALISSNRKSALWRRFVTDAVLIGEASLAGSRAPFAP